MTQVAFASAADTREQAARLVELADNVYGFVSDFDPNCGFIVGDDGVLVIDTRATPRLARELRDVIASVTRKPVKYVFLTHYHAVRVLGASVFADATVICSAGTLDGIRTRGDADFASEAGRFPRLFQGIEEIPGLTLPHVTFDDALTLWFGDREIRLRHVGAGHSRGDAVCWLPAERVLFSGDLVENRCGVYAGDGYLRAWSKTLAALRQLDAQGLLPGRGAALRGTGDVRGAIDATQRFIDTVLDCVGRAIERGASLQQCYVQTLETMQPVFGDWPVFQHVLPFNVNRAFEELQGTEHPTVWTAERDADLWHLLHG